MRASERKNWKINSAQEIIYFIFISHFQWSTDLDQTARSSLSSTINDNSLEMPCCVCVCYSIMFVYDGAILGDLHSGQFLSPRTEYDVGYWNEPKANINIHYPSFVLIAEKLSFFCCTVSGKPLDLRFFLLHLAGWSKCNYDYLEFMRWLFSMDTSLWCNVNVILCDRKFK